MKKILSLILALSLVFGAVSILSSCGPEKENDTTLVTVDINPSVEFIVEGGKVVDVYGANEDGQVILYQEAELIGLTPEKAVEKLTEAAIELGYLSEENKVVGTYVSSTDASYAKSLETKLNTKIEATAENGGLTVTATVDGMYSALRKLEALKAENPDNQDIQNMTASEFRLVISAAETGEITIEAAAKLDTKELISIVNTHHKNVETFATEAFLEVKQTADAAYDVAVGLANELVYTEFYIKHMLSHPTTLYYGGLYSAYSAAARTLEITADAITLMNNIRNYPMSDAQVEKVLTALGLTDADRALIENSDGEVTVKSVEAYADKLFKNSEEGAALTAQMNALTEALNTLETDLKAVRKEKMEQYADTIAAAEATMNSAVDTVLTLLPAEVKAELEDAKEIFEDAKALVADGDFSVMDMRALAKRLTDKASGLKEMINADLSEEELEEIKEKQAEVTEKMAAEKAKFDKALADAEADAKEHLAALRDARLEKISSQQ